MYSTLLMTLLATAPMAPSQYYGAYGNYGGSYGAYGAYGGGNGYVMPYYMYPYVQIGGAEDEKARAEKEAAEEKLNEIQSNYGKLDQRLAGLERLLTTMEPYLKAQETIQEERHKALDVKLEARMQALEKVQAFAGLESQVTLGMAKLEDKIQNFETRLRGSDGIPDSLMAKLDSLGQSNLNIENRLLRIEANPTLPALDGGNEQVKAMISGVEDKLGLGLTLLEDRLKQMEDRLSSNGLALPAVNGNASNTNDTLNQMSRNLEKRFELLEQKLQQKDEFDTKIRSHEREVLDTTIKQNFTKLQTSLTTTPGAKGEDANRRVNRAVVLITLPADARLYINGMESTVGTNLRTFVTPELEANKHYYYTIRVEVVRNGQLTTDAQRVYFQRGEEVRVSFDHMENAIGGEMLLDRKKNG